MRILFITSNRLGDAVLTTGLLAWLVERYPSAAFTITCGPVAADLFRAVPRLEKLIVLPKKKRNAHWFDLWRACFGTRWHLIVDLRNSIVSRLLLADQRAYRPAHGTGLHKVIDNAQALHLDPPPPPFIWTDPQANKAAETLVPDAGMALALGPAANWPAKQWPTKNYVQLVRLLTSPDAPFAKASVLIAAASHERKQLEPLLGSLPASQIIDVIGCDLLTVAACLRRCRLYIGNDSGLMHVAAAMHVPTLGLFGPGHPEIYGPWGNHTAVISTPESAEELLARKAQTPNLMETLTVDKVYIAAEALLKPTRA